MIPCHFLALRPLAPSDQPALQALFARLSPEEIRWRFGYAMPCLSDDQAARWCAPDGLNHHAIGLASLTGLHGVARAFVNGGTAEMAVLVERAHAGRGWGERLAREVLAALDVQGVRRVRLDVAADNVRMLRLAKKLGFAMQPADDPVQRVWFGNLHPQNHLRMA